MLNKDFYNRDAKTIAQELLGKIIVHKNKKGIIVETEAYFSEDDPATYSDGRWQSKFLPDSKPGYSYVYQVHKYMMFEVLTKKFKFPGMVFIRAVEPLENVSLPTNGPGRWTRAFEITRAHNNINITSGDLHILDSENKPEIAAAKRIGLSKYASQAGRDALMRFYIKNNPFVSKN